MVSSKGNPTDPKLHEEVEKDVKQLPNKDGSGKGHMAAWKAAKISKEYEERGGGYKNDKNELGSKKKPSTGAPEPKSESGKAAEVKADGEKPKGEDKPKANSGKKATGPKKSVTKPKAENKLKKPHAEGTRKSTRVGNKRKAPPKDEEDEEEEEEEEKDEGEAEEGQEKIKKRKKAPAKKAKTSKK